MFPPMTTGYEARGSITDKSIEFYRQIAKGGAALIILGDVAPVKTLSPIPMLVDDSQIESFKKLTDVVHEEGALIGAQIFHPEYNPAEIFKLFMAKDMMALRKKLHHDMEHYVNEVSIEELQKIKKSIVTCAIRANAAGFDMIQIHGDRLIGALSSPILNKRTDKYGGTLENRTRFALEIVQGIRQVLPEIAIDYKLAMIRTNPPMGKGGPTIEEGKWLAQQLERQGVNSIHACQANHSSVSVTIPAAATAPFMCFSDFSEAIKSVVNIPVSAVGRIVKPAHAKEVLDTNKADIISMGRALIADPEWVNKFSNGKECSIRYCIMCNKGCTDKIIGRQSVACAINAKNGIEFEIKETENKKTVMVIGGGPAGMEATRVLSQQGHNVHLYEKTSKLGGQLKIATLPEHKVEMENIKDHLIKEVEQSTCSINLNAKVTKETIKSLNPDHIILATGATPKTLNVLDEHKDVISAWDVLNGAETGKDVVIIGGGSVGIEVAGFIHDNVKSITVIENTPNLLNGESISLKQFLLDDLKDKGITVMTEAQINTIKEDSIILDNWLEIKCDTVIYAVGAHPNNELEKTLKDLDINYSIIGDAKEPRLLENAIREAFETSVKL